MSECLVLNKNWMPVRICGALEAIVKVYSEKAHALDKNYVMHDWDSWLNTWEDAARVSTNIVRAVNFDVAAPDVIVLRSYKGFVRKRAKLSRRNIFLRDGGICQYCGTNKRSNEFNVDHVVPKAKGGKTRWKNVVLSCVKCNHRKRDRTPEEAGMNLLRKPFEPKWHNLQADLIKKNYDSWKELLGDFYWNVELEK